MTATHTLYTIRAAAVDDIAAVHNLLAVAGLPTEGLDEQFGAQYAVAESAGRIIGAAGVEVYGGYGLLRSAAVEPGWRGRGVGEALTRERLDWARARGLEALFLLTTTAAEYFPRFGFERIERAAAPEPIRQSREFASVCPSTAVAMRLALR